MTEYTWTLSRLPIFCFLLLLPVLLSEISLARMERRRKSGSATGCRLASLAILKSNAPCSFRPSWMNSSRKWYDVLILTVVVVVVARIASVFWLVCDWMFFYGFILFSFVVAWTLFGMLGRARVCQVEEAVRVQAIFQEIYVMLWRILGGSESPGNFQEIHVIFWRTWRTAIRCCYNIAPTSWNGWDPSWTVSQSRKTPEGHWVLKKNSFLMIRIYGGSNLLSNRSSQSCLYSAVDCCFWTYSSWTSGNTESTFLMFLRFWNPVPSITFERSHGVPHRG